jgi:hypothetical protein
MAKRYSNHKGIAEKEALDRWENEGGLLTNAKV